MFGRKKGFRAIRLKLMSYRMRSATYGTHVPRRARPARQDMNAKDVGFSNSRKKRRAARGIVDHVTPRTATREGSRDYSRRMSRRPNAKDVQRKAGFQRAAVIVVLAVVVLCAAGGVGSAAFLGSVNGKLSLNDSNASDALVASDSDAYYLLCAASLGTAQGVSGPEDDAYLLVRVDEEARAISVISVPSNLKVQLSDGETHPLYDAAALGGDAELIEAVASFAGVDIAHFAQTDAEGMVALVDAVGGVSMQVEEEVDDPAAGDVYLAAGEQDLDGAAALTLLRANNYSGGVESQAANRTALFVALAEKLMEPRGWSLFTLLDDTAVDVQTDWKARRLVSLAGNLRNLSAAYTACVPGYETESDGVTLFAASTSDWEDMVERLEAGEDPAAPEEEVPDVDPASFTVAVRNGTDTSGSAARLAELLEEQGFDVVETGNTDDYTTYPETLVIYLDDDYADAAEVVAAAMDAGRVIDGSIYYSFTADVLVIIGTDYQSAA